MLRPLVAGPTATVSGDVVSICPSHVTVRTRCGLANGFVAVLTLINVSCVVSHALHFRVILLSLLRLLLRLLFNIVVVVAAAVAVVVAATAAAAAAVAAMLGTFSRIGRTTNIQRYS